MKSILSSILVFFVLAMAVSAVEGVSFLNDSVSLSALPGASDSVVAQINNTGDEPIDVLFSGYSLTYSTYTFDLEAIDDETNIAPEETRDITVEGIVPANQVAGMYTGTLTATAGAASDTLSVEFEVLATGAGLVLLDAPDDGSAVPGTTVTATFAVDNERNEALTVNVSGTLSSGSETLEITEKSIVFSAFENKTVSVSIVVPNLQDAGSYTGDIVLAYEGGSLDVSYTLVVNESARFTASSASVFAKPGQSINTTITLTKTGNADPTGINASYVSAGLTDGDGDRTTVVFHPESVDLTGATATVIVELFVSSRMNSGDYSSVISFTSDQGTAAQATLALEIESVLEVTDINLDSDGRDDELKPGEDLTIEIEITNNDDDIDVENIEVTVMFIDSSGRYLEDDDGDDIEETSDEFDLDAGDDDTVFITVTMPTEDIDDGDDYFIEITVEGRNADDRSQIFKIVDNSEEITIVKLDHEIVFTELSIGPETLRCSTRATIAVGLENIGRKDEDVQLVIKSDKLDLYMLRTFTLDKDPDDSDNTWEDTLSFDVDEDIVNGAYNIIVEAYYDRNDESLVNSLTLRVDDCQAPPTGGNGNGNTGGNTGEGDIEIVTPPPAPIVPPTSVEKSDSSTQVYVIALALLLLVLIVLVVWLGALALKKR